MYERAQHVVNRSAAVLGTVGAGATLYTALMTPLIPLLDPQHMAERYADFETAFAWSFTTTVLCAALYVVTRPTRR